MSIIGAPLRPLYTLEGEKLGLEDAKVRGATKALLEMMELASSHSAAVGRGRTGLEALAQSLAEVRRMGND